MNKNYKKISKYKLEDKKSFVFCYLLLLIPVVQFLIFWVYVNASSIGLAFTDEETGAFSLINFKNLIESFRNVDVKVPRVGSLGNVIGNSVILWLCVNILCTPAIMFSTYVLYKKITGHYIFRLIFAVPSIVGPVVFTSILKNLVAYDGPIIALLCDLGVNLPENAIIDGLIFNEKTGFITIVLLNVIPHLIACDVVLTGAFTRIPKEIQESASLDGMSFIREYISIAIPLAWPTICITLTTSLATLFTADGLVFLYTNGGGDYGTATTGFLLYYMVNTMAEGGAPLYNYPAAMGVMLTCMTLPIIFITKFALGKMFDTVEF